MGRSHFDSRRALHPNPGLPRDFLGGEIVIGEHRALMTEAETRRLIERDTMPIPAPEDRENYYGGRHLEYWLSGLLDARRLTPWLPEEGTAARYLDFGGSSGRVTRHLARRNDLTVWLCDINANGIAWVDAFFSPPIAAFQNRVIPSLPITDGYFDLVSAFSVFTHLDYDEIPWLLELRRIVRPGGHIYATVLDEPVWDRLNDPAWAWLLKSFSRGLHDDRLAALTRNPLTERIVLEYSTAETYNVNIFLPRSYLIFKWGRFFKSIQFFEGQHNYQTVVVLQVP